MLVFDASSLILAWDNYPVEQFPGLWEWMDGQFSSGEFQVPRVAFDEVRQKIPEFADWLKNHGAEPLATTPGVLLDARRIKQLLGIEEENYHPKGVGENDLLIIATAREQEARLVTDEARQFGQQKDPRKRKIPAVCDMAGVDVDSLSFLETIKEYGAVFR